MVKNQTVKLKPLQYFEEEFNPAEELTSTWINPTKDTFTFNLMVDKKNGKYMTGSVFKRITLKPKETITLPVEYDAAIRTPHKDNAMIIMGGKCPHLQKVGEDPHPTLHDSLDYNKANAAEKMKALKKEIEAQKEMDAVESFLKRREAEEAALYVDLENYVEPGNDPSGKPTVVSNRGKRAASTLNKPEDQL